MTLKAYDICTKLSYGYDLTLKRKYKPYLDLSFEREPYIRSPEEGEFILIFDMKEKNGLVGKIKSVEIDGGDSFFFILDGKEEPHTLAGGKLVPWQKGFHKIELNKVINVVTGDFDTILFHLEEYGFSEYKKDLARAYTLR